MLQNQWDTDLCRILLSGVQLVGYLGKMHQAMLGDIAPEAGLNALRGSVQICGSIFIMYPSLNDCFANYRGKIPAPILMEPRLELIKCCRISRY